MQMNRTPDPFMIGGLYNKNGGMGNFGKLDEKGEKWYTLQDYAKRVCKGPKGQIDP